MCCCCSCCGKKKDTTHNQFPILVDVPRVNPVDEPKIIQYIMPPMFTSSDFQKLKEKIITERKNEKEKREIEDIKAQNDRFQIEFDNCKVIVKQSMANLLKNSANQQMEDLSGETLEGQSYNEQTLFGPQVLREFATKELLQDSLELTKKQIKALDLQKVKLVKKSVNSTSYIVKYKDDYYFYKEFGYSSKNSGKILGFLQNFENQRSDAQNPAQTQQLQDLQNPLHQVDIDSKCQQQPLYFLQEQPFLGLLFRIEEYNLYTFCLLDVELPIKCKLAADMVQFVSLQIQHIGDLSKTSIKPSSILFRRLNQTPQPSYKLLLASWYTRPLSYTNEHSLFLSHPSSSWEGSQFSPSNLLGIQLIDQLRQEQKEKEQKEQKEKEQRNKENYILTLSKTLLILMFFRIDLTRESHDICSGIQGRCSFNQSIRNFSTSKLINHEEVNGKVQQFIDSQSQSEGQRYSEIYSCINKATKSEELMNDIRNLFLRPTRV